MYEDDTTCPASRPILKFAWRFRWRWIHGRHPCFVSMFRSRTKTDQVQTAGSAGLEAPAFIHASNLDHTVLRTSKIRVYDLLSPERERAQPIGLPYDGRHGVDYLSFYLYQ